MPLITTERLYISKAEVEDAPFFFELLNSPNWIQHIGDRGIKTIKDAVHYVQNGLIHNYETAGYGFYKMVNKEEDKPIGICGFAKREYLDHVDIGFAILPEYERKGYTYEASIAVLQYGTNTLKLEPILGITTIENIGSRNILLKIGLKQVGTILSDDNEELLLFSNQ